MSDTVIITSIYREFWGTEEFRKSVERTGLPLVNVWKNPTFTGHGDSFKFIYEAMQELKNDYKYMIYSDGADTYFIRGFVPPAGKVIYSAEKACYPHPDKACHYPVVDSPWKYLNGGNYSSGTNYSSITNIIISPTNSFINYTPH